MNGKIFGAALSVLKTSFFPEKPCRLPELTTDEWYALFNELKVQSVPCLVNPVLDMLPMPQELRAEWEKFILGNAGSFVNYIYVQNELVTLMKQNGFNFVIIKGAALAQYYPCPELRLMGDIDLLLPEKDFSAGEKLLAENGYKQRSYYNGRHTEYKKDGVMLELHSRFGPARKNRDIPTEFEPYFESEINSASAACILGYDFPVFSETANGISMLSHIAQHMPGGLGLRHIADWLMFANRHRGDGFFEGGFIATAERFGLGPLLNVITKTCCMYLGLDITDFGWCSGTRDGLCEAFINHIEESGNFGRKRDDGDSMKNLLTKRRGFFNIIKHLQRDGTDRIAAVSKHRFLRPFAWLFMLCHYIKSLLKHKVTPEKIAKAREKSKEKQELFKSLNI